MLPTKFITISRVLSRFSPQMTVKSRVFSPPVINNIRFKYSGSGRRDRGGGGGKRKTSSYETQPEHDSEEPSSNPKSADYNIFDDK